MHALNSEDTDEIRPVHILEGYPVGHPVGYLVRLSLLFKTLYNATSDFFMT